MNVPVANKIVAALERDSEALSRTSVKRTSLLRLADETLGEDMRRFEDGRMLIWDIARHDGYTIPPYPMAGCGDVREFLADEGAKNVPDWYKNHLGIDQETYDHMYAYQLVMVRNRALYRRVWVIPVAEMQGTVERLGHWTLEWIKFALSNVTDEQDPRLFRR